MAAEELHVGDAALSAEQVNLAGMTDDIAVVIAAGGDSARVLETCAQTIVDRLPGVFVRAWILDEQNVLRLAASAGDDDWVHRERDISFLGYPLVLGTRVLGVLAAFSRWKLNEDTAATLSSIAERVAIGLDRRGVGRKLYLQDRAIAASSNGIVITDPRLPDNPIIYANYGFERMTGYEQSEIFGRNCRLLQGEDQDQQEVREIRAAIEARRECQVVLRNYRKDGELFYNELSLSPVFDDEGELLNFIGIQNDVTARVTVEQERDALLHKVEDALTVRDRFISTASHEMRNPITVIKAHAQLLARRARHSRDAELLDHLLTIDRQASTLRSLISDLLDVTRIETGQMSFAMEELNVVEVLREVVGEARTASPEFDLQLVEGEQELWVRADRMRIQQVLSNLLTNAIKYSGDQRNVEVLVSCEGSDARISVRDWGIGIPAEQQAGIFGLYFRADNATAQGRQGLGLGLHISKNIVDAHNGRLCFQSEVRQGTTFYLFLPLVG